MEIHVRKLFQIYLVTQNQLKFYKACASLINECGNCWVTFLGPTQLSHWSNGERYNPKQSRCLDQAYLILAQSKALFINPQIFFADMVCKTKKGKKDEHFTACWENKDLFSKLILSVLEFSRFFFTVVVTWFEFEFEKKQNEASGSIAPPLTPLDDGIRDTIAKVESKKCISELQNLITDCSMDDKLANALAAQQMEQSDQKTFADAKEVPLTLRENSKTRYALSMRAGFPGAQTKHVYKSRRAHRTL